MTIEKRLENLENLVNALSKKIDNNKFYTDADINGNRKSVSDITPYTETKTAYIDDTDVVFLTEVKGNLTVYLSEEIPYTVTRDADRITVSFEPLEQITDVTISIL